MYQIYTIVQILYQQEKKKMRDEEEGRDFERRNEDIVEKKMKKLQTRCENMKKEM